MTTKLEALILALIDMGFSEEDIKFILTEENKDGWVEGLEMFIADFQQ